MAFQAMDVCYFAIWWQYMQLNSTSYESYEDEEVIWGVKLLVYLEIFISKKSNFTRDATRCWFYVKRKLAGWSFSSAWGQVDVRSSVGRQGQALNGLSHHGIIVIIIK